MSTKTFHIFRDNGRWSVKKEGRREEIFRTKKEALDSAVSAIKRNSGQVNVYDSHGKIVERRTFGLPPVPQPPKKSLLGDRRIAKAVREVVFQRLRGAGSKPLSAATISKS